MGQWIALSHCWGQAKPLTSTRETLNERIAGIPVSLCPPLFRDAMCIVRELGYQYLWIDTLCILQGDPQDWLIESAAMERVYGDATLCLAAEDCEDSRTGIFESGNKLRQNYQERIQIPCVDSTRPGICGNLYTGPDWLPTRSFPGPLSRRAWTLQEEILSPRTLKWTSKQIEWGCRTIERVEQFPDEDYHYQYHFHNDMMACKQIFAMRQHHLPPVDPVMQDAVYSLWTQIVSRLSVRIISYKTDRLPALSGIANVVQKRTGWTYKAGLWLEKIHEGLLWDVKSSAEQVEISKEYIAPTWSWASIFYQKSYRGMTWGADKGHRSKAERDNTFPGMSFPKFSRGWTTTTVIEKVNVVTIGDEFGRVQEATLQISGLARRSGRKVYLQILDAPYFARLDPGEALEDNDQTPPIGIVHHGITLEKLRRCIGPYRRVGTFKIYDRQISENSSSRRSEHQVSETQTEHLNKRWKRQTFKIV